MEQSGGRSGRRKLANRDWTKGNIFHNLLALSWPIVVGNSLNLLGPVVDMIWIAKLGAASIAGVGVASMVVILITSARQGFSQGTRALVARSVGADDYDGANHIAQQGFLSSAVYTIVVAVIGIMFAAPIMRLFGLAPDVVAQGASYMRVLFIATVVQSFRMMAEAIMQASGDTVTPMRVTLSFRVLHMIISPMFIFGVLFFPRLGATGSATANAISQTVGAGLDVWVLFSGRSRLQLTLRHFRLDLGVIWRLLKIGIPASLMNAERTFGNLVLISIMAPFGTVAVAAHALIQRMQAILRMPNMGLGIGAGVLAGQNLGAGQPKRAERGGWLAMGMGEIFSILASVAILIWAEPVVRIFNSTPDVVRVTSLFLRIGAAGYATMGAYYVLQNALNGTGDTMPPMLVTLLNFWLVQIPLALVLPKYFGMGVAGVRWGMSAGMIIGAIVYVIYFIGGRWKKKRV